MGDDLEGAARDQGPILMDDIALKDVSAGAPKVLVVDDDRFIRMMLCQMLVGLGYETLEAANGKEGLAAIKQNWKQLDAILLDRNMPEMDGMEVVARLKESPELRWLPIIMATGSDRKEEIQEGIEAGVFHYLVKPVDAEVLKSVIAVASREAQEHRQLLRELADRSASFQHIKSCTCTLKTLPEAHLVAGLLANCFSEPERIISGLAELIYNAVEHGNLGITYDEKTELLNREIWKQEVARRGEAPEYKDKYVEVRFHRSDKGCHVAIKDQGKGFAWRNYLQIDPARASDNHGRGIAQANMVSFDELTYNTAGNEVTVFSSNKKGIEW
jgi:two-component system, cell cycle response regulator